MITELKATQIVEIELSANKKEYSLKDQEILRDHPIMSMVAYKSGLATDGSDIADPSNAYLYPVERDNSKILLPMPLRSMIYNPEYPVLQFIAFPRRPFSWEKSKIKFAVAPTTGQVLQLLVAYDHEKTWNNV